VSPVPVTAVSDDRAEALLRDFLGAFEHVLLPVSGACMEPAVPEGSVVRVTSVVRRPPRLGDVVLVRHREGLRLHRLVLGPPLPAVRWRTQADRAVLWDRPLAKDEAIGTVIGIETGRGLQPVASVVRALRSVASGLRRRLFGQRVP
jgi:hypothetical protein